MQLETLIVELGISEHMKPLSDWRDSLLREKAEEIQGVVTEAAAKLAEVTAAKDEAVKAFADKQAYQDAMVAKVTAVLQSGDPAQYEALALEFLTPEQEKIRAEKLAQFEALKAELGI